MRIEVVIAGISTGGLLALIALLSIWPNILGTNVSAAYGMLTVVLVVPAVRNLLEFHSELLFGFGNLGLRAAITGTLVLIKAFAVAALITLFPAPESWTLGLNAASALIYGLSFLAVYGLLTRNAA
jgi:hypothetical protein